jgi:hypothetical protein
MNEPFDPYHKWLGIPPKDQPPNHYRLLGVELFESDLDVIENAADQRMRHVRSFQNGPHQAQSQKLLNEIAFVKVCLLDAQQKIAYDAMLAGPTPNEESVRIDTLASEGSTGRVVTATSAAQRRRPAKNPVIELTKIVAGGIAGIGIAFLLLSFLREDWDMLGIAKAVRGSGANVQPQPDDPDPIPVEPPVPSPNTVAVTPPKPVPLAPLEGVVEANKFEWTLGKSSLDLGPCNESFLVFSSIGGHFLGDGEWFDAEVDENEHYRLKGGAVKLIGAVFTRVRSPYRVWFEDEVQQFQWSKGKPRVQLIHQHDGFAVLSGANGCFLGPEHLVRVYLDADDGYWYLEGKTNFNTRGRALVYKFKQPGKFRAEVSQFDWKPGDKRREHFRCEEGLCFISSMSGRFQGYGENLNAKVESDGVWQTWGASQAGSTRGSFVAIRLNTPELLALAPGQPDLAYSDKLPPVVKTAPMPEPAPQVEPPKPDSYTKGPPPQEADLTTARENLGELLEQQEVSELLSAAESGPPAERFALLQAAHGLAIQAGDPLEAFRVIEVLLRLFELSPLELKTETLLSLRETCDSAAANRALATQALQVCESAITSGQHDTAIALAELSVAAARKGEDVELTRRATLKLIELRK